MKKKKQTSTKILPKSDLKPVKPSPIGIGNSCTRGDGHQSNKKGRCKFCGTAWPVTYPQGRRAKKTFTVEELEAALVEAERDFDSAVLRVMLLGETLRSIKEDDLLKGDKIELGVLRQRLTREVRGWFKEFGYRVSDGLITKEFNGVPIEIKVIKKHYPFFEHLDSVLYGAFDALDVPNPWRAYWKVRGLIR